MINLNKKGDTMSEDKTESTQDLKKEKKQNIPRPHQDMNSISSDYST